MLVKAGAPVESTIDLLIPLLEKGDIIIDGGNEWYENTEHRQKKVAEKGLMYLGMGVSGGEEGARNGQHQLASQYILHKWRIQMLLLTRNGSHLQSIMQKIKPTIIGMHAFGNAPDILKHVEFQPVNSMTF